MVKRKIALVIDTDNWAFKTTAKMIKKGLDKYYNVDIFTLEYLNGNLVKFFLIFEDYDLIHFLWREPLVNLIKPHFEEYTWLIGSDRDTFIKEKINFNKITVGVYDHLFLDEDFYKTKYIFSKIKRYCVSSKKLFRIYNQLDVKYHPTCVINDGIDTNKFIPRNLERFDSFKRDIVIGFSGNSNFANGKGDLKGMNTIIKPAINQLQKEGLNIKTNFADSYVKKIPYNEMNNYYNSIDILLSTSITEGTPLPILEAMSCGVPIITTNVGIVEEAFGPLQKRYILKERSVDALKEAIKKMITDDKISDISKENIKMSKHWDFKYKAKDYKNFFDKCIEENEKDDIKNTKK